MQRTAVVQNVFVNSIVSSSIIQAGDTRLLTPSSNALAVQRQESVYDPNEHTFDIYPIFTQPFPPNPLECIPVNTINENPTIHLNNIHIIGIAAASVIRFGNTDYISAQSRVKHIREFTINPYE